MKKFISIILSAVILLSLFSCSDSQNQNQSDTAPSGELKSINSRGFSFSNNFGTKDGFYYFTENTEIGKNLYGMHLMYVDYATKKEIYLCSDSGCKHDSEKCSSVFSADEFGFDSIPFVYDDHLYVLSRDYDNDDTVSLDYFAGNDTSSDVQPQSNNAKIYCMELDGSSRQKIFDFPENSTVTKEVFAEGDNLWFVTKNLKFKKEDNATYITSSDKALCKYSISQNKITEQIPIYFDDNVNYQVIGCSDTKFVLSGIAYPDNMSQTDILKLHDDQWHEAYKNSKTVYATLDITNREKNEILKHSNNKLNITDAVEGQYLYVSDEKGGINKIDLETGEQSVLTDLKQNYIYFSIGDTLCCTSTGDEKDESLYFVDMETGKVSRSTLTKKSLGWQLTILAYTDTHALAVYDYDAIAKDDDSYEINQYKYALIAKEDLYNSKENFEPISMAGKGRE